VGVTGEPLGHARLPHPRTTTATSLGATSGDAAPAAFEQRNPWNQIKAFPETGHEPAGGRRLDAARESGSAPQSYSRSSWAPGNWVRISFGDRRPLRRRPRLRCRSAHPCGGDIAQRLSFLGQFAAVQQVRGPRAGRRHIEGRLLQRRATWCAKASFSSWSIQSLTKSRPIRRKRSSKARRRAFRLQRASWPVPKR